MAAAAFGCAQAQDIQRLDPVVFSAARMAQPLSEVLPSVSVISREEIQRAQAATLFELLEADSGIELGRNGGVGAVSSLFLRGQNAVSTAVFVDGVRLQTDQIGFIRLNNIPTHRIDRIEILRGNVSALYGESAIGGVVHLYTRPPDEASPRSASLGLGARGTRTANASLTGKADDLAYAISLDHLATRGFSARDPSQASTNADDDGYQRQGVFLAAEKSFSSEVSIGLQLSQIRNDLEFDSNFGANRLTEELEGKTRNTEGILSATITPSEHLSTRAAVSWRHEDYKEFSDAVQLAPASGGLITGRQRALQIDNRLLRGTQTLLFGLEVTIADFNARAVRHDRQTRGIYGGINQDLGRFSIQTNLRYDWVEGKSDAAATEAQKGSWLAGLGYRLTEALRLSATASTGFRAPATGELYGFGGTLSLLPETHRSIEAGVSLASQVGHSRMVFFQTKTDNAIVYDSSCGVPYTDCYGNLARVENQGIELHHRAQLGIIGIKAGYTIQRPRNVSSVAFAGQQNDRLARRADHFGSIAITTRLAKTDLALQARHSGDRVDGARLLESYTLVHLTASKALANNLVVRLRLENALDERYQLAYGFNTPRRGLFAMLEYRD
jgi:vitamin B12 transporter